MSVEPAVIADLEARMQVLRRRAEWLAKLILDYEAVLADLKKDRPSVAVGRRVPGRVRMVLKAVVGLEASVSYKAAPPEVRVRVRAPQGEDQWDGKAPIHAVMAVEGAIRDAAWHLFGRRTSPGFMLSLKPPKLTADGAWIEARVLVIPSGDCDRKQVLGKIVAASTRASASLEKTGVKIVTEAPEGQEVATT